jgi:selenocysteine-specific elongation factor
MIVGTAGHIDHGKTSLVRALTGVDTDRLPEERRRGISIELGYAYATRALGEPLGFIDVPGHERLVHTMVAGAGGVDFALLVVAADDGVMPQTREHLAILELLGVRHAAVALTKVTAWRTRKRSPPSRRSSICWPPPSSATRRYFG